MDRRTDRASQDEFITECDRVSDRTELIPRSVGKREREERERRELQQSPMDVRRLEQQESKYHHTVAASQDRDYMTAALVRVREKAHITRSDDVTRISGSYLYNKTLDNKSVKECPSNVITIFRKLQKGSKK